MSIPDLDHLQDTVLIVPPYPYVLEDPSDVPLDDCWIVCPQLYFTCHLRPTNGRQPKARHTYGEDDISVELVFFSTFEELALPGSGPMESSGVQKYYEPSPTPILYVGPVANVLGRVPLMPLFLHGNSTPTIPHQLRKHQRSKFPYGCADASDKSGRKGSNVYEVNQWLWQFGRGKPRLGGLSVVDTEERRIAVMQGGAKRGHATRTKRKLKGAKAAAREAPCGGE
jgi:hypothetical protein